MDKYQNLKDLVAFDTVKDKENKAIINYVEEFLSNQGFKTEYKGKALIMSIGENPQLGFLGHTDTVEYIEGWDNSPFELTQKDGFLYGLGSCDMKGGIAAMMQAISETDFSELKYGMKMYITYDEEIGFGGMHDIVQLKESFPKTMIFGEPTDNQLLVGSKGIMEYEFNFEGIKAHSSNPAKGKSATLNAVKFLTQLDKFYNEQIKNFEEYSYEVPYTTMNIGVINGGTALNSVAASCRVIVDFRIANNEHIEQINNKVEELAKLYDCQVYLGECLESFISETDLTNEKKTANFLTEASLVEGVNRIILGPGPVTAHEVNEHISEKSYDKLVQQYKEIIQKKCS